MGVSRRAANSGVKQGIWDKTVMLTVFFQHLDSTTSTSCHQGKLQMLLSSVGPSSRLPTDFRQGVQPKCGSIWTTHGLTGQSPAKTSSLRTTFPPCHIHPILPTFPRLTSTSLGISKGHSKAGGLPVSKSWSKLFVITLTKLGPLKSGVSTTTGSAGLRHARQLVAITFT